MSNSLDRTSWVSVSAGAAGRGEGCGGAGGRAVRCTLHTGRAYEPQEGDKGIYYNLYYTVHDISLYTRLTRRGVRMNMNHRAARLSQLLVVTQALQVCTGAPLIPL